MVFIVLREGTELRRDDLWFDFGHFCVRRKSSSATLTESI